MVTFEQVYQLAEQLPLDEQLDLAEKLRAKVPLKFTRKVTREILLAEHARLKSIGAFENVESLYGKYANPDDLARTDNLWQRFRDDIIKTTVTNDD